MALKGKYKLLAKHLLRKLPNERLHSDDLVRYAYGTDASMYRMIPELVVVINSEEELVFLIKTANEYEVSLTFRAAGTSLSGQAVTDSVLVLLGKQWSQIEIRDLGEWISMGPSVIGGTVNHKLKSYGRKIGPDPASIDSAMIAGIIANNASGMCCGVAHNSYKTIKDARFVLSDGTILDTADSESVRSFLSARNAWINRLLSIADRVKSDQELRELILKKYKIKNTTGYSLNALIDFDDPIEIIKHLFVGSEGTFGFISRVDLKTIKEDTYKSAAFFLFKNIHEACRAISFVRGCNVRAAELLDSPSLKSVMKKKGFPFLQSNIDDRVTALLVEVGAETKEDLKSKEILVLRSLTDFNPLEPFAFYSEEAVRKQYWDIRKGLFPTVGASRKAGTTVVLEDCAFPEEQLAQGVIDIQELFVKYGFSDGIIFGHALEGNLHFLLTIDFKVEQNLKHYGLFMHDLSELVAIKHKGSLKAEHGTGRNMAPFVEMEWGSTAYKIMQELKELFDPVGILNPDVILSQKAEIHLQHIKELPVSNELIDQCIECGFCESHCPSNQLTFSPRQRIAAYRLIQNLPKGIDRNRLSANFRYYGDDTCATCSMCELSCPVGIDTGKLIKEWRSAQIGVPHIRRMGRISSNFKGFIRFSKRVLAFAHLFRNINPIFFDKVLSKLHYFRPHIFPFWDAHIPTVNRFKQINTLVINGQDQVVYFSTCLNRVFNGVDKTKSIQETVLSLIRKAGMEVRIPGDMDRLCCGKPFETKGFKKQGIDHYEELNKELLRVSEGGKWPIVIDMSPCSLYMKEMLDKRLKMYDPINFANSFLVDRLTINKLDKTVSVHLTCSDRKMVELDALKALVEKCVHQVIVPEGIECCGFAGDRGFMVPELPHNALFGLKEQVHSCEKGYSTSKTCEIGLSREGGITYESVFYLLDEVSEQFTSSHNR